MSAPFPVIDLHCDTIMWFAIENKRLRGLADGHISLEKLQKGGAMAQCFAIFVPTNKSAERIGITSTPEEYFDLAYRRYAEELEDCSDVLAPAYSAADIERNHKNGKISAVLTVEDCVTLRGDLARIDDWHKKGVRMAALTWNYENSIGFPNSSDPVEHARGLKPFGFEAVRRMNELGVIVDVSHLSEGGFWDVVRTTERPFVASHSCARALCDVSRDLTDEQLRALADKGGVCGINFATGFLRRPTGDRESDNFTEISDVVRHLKHMRDIAGIDALALGSDYDGIGSRLEWADYSGYPLLLDAIEREFGAEETEKIAWRNALRVFRDNSPG